MRNKRGQDQYGLLWINKGDTFALGTDGAFYGTVVTVCKEPFAVAMRERWPKWAPAAVEWLFIVAVNTMRRDQRGLGVNVITTCVLDHLLGIAHGLVVKAQAQGHGGKAWEHYGLVWSNKGDSFPLGTDDAFYRKLQVHCAPPFKRTLRKRWPLLRPQELDGMWSDALHTLLENQMRKGVNGLSCSVLTYLNAIGHNLASKAYREAKRTVRSDDALLDQVAGAFVDNVEAEMRHARLVAVMRELLPLLRAKDQQLLRLYYFKDRSMAEIASEVGIASAGAAKKAKCLAQKKLGSLIAKRWHEEDGWRPQAA